MLYEEMLRKEYNAGRVDGIIEGQVIGRQEGMLVGRLESKIEDILQLLNARFTVSDELSKNLHMVDEEEILSQLLLDAALAESIESFESKLEIKLSNQN